VEDAGSSWTASEERPGVADAEEDEGGDEDGLVDEVDEERVSSEEDEGG
jgi:hypothetical protein